MRLIIEYQVSDGYTYCATITLPVVYQSVEHFAVDFKKFCKDNHPFISTFAGQEWDTTDFIARDGRYDEPRIVTVDEFFAEVENETK